jgi:hypothetical protein
MENRPDTAAGSVAPAGCSKWNEREKTRDGSETTIEREDSPPSLLFFMKTRNFE